MFMQKLLRKEEPEEIRFPKKMRSTKREIHLCDGCGHLYFYKIIRCPLCESHNIKVVNEEMPKAFSKRQDVVSRGK